MTRIALLIALLATLIVAGSATANEVTDNNYADRIFAYSDRVQDIFDDGDANGYTSEHLQELISVSAQHLVDIESYDVSNCLDEDKMLYTDKVLSDMAFYGYMLYLFEGDVGTPLNDADSETFIEITYRASSAWQNYPINCG